LEYSCFEFVSNFGLPRRDFIGTFLRFSATPVLVLVTISDMPCLGGGFRFFLSPKACPWPFLGL
jgi:hypothetical protein